MVAIETLDGKCEECEDRCISCTSSTSCLECLDGYHVVNGLCEVKEHGGGNGACVLTGTLYGDYMAGENSNTAIQHTTEPNVYIFYRNSGENIKMIGYEMDEEHKLTKLSERYAKNIPKR
jgi:hypothetical protein